MMSFIYSVLHTTRAWFGLIIPLFHQATDFANWGRWAWHTLHVLVIGCVIALLYWLNNSSRFPIHDWLHARLHAHPGIEMHFLPLVFLLIYALAWVMWWIWSLLGPDAELDLYPDITSAWVEGLSNLAQKGIKPTDLPLFLVLGRSKAGEEFLFQAGGVKVDAFGPKTGDPPVRLWASRDAIYVTTPGASALGRYADMLIGGGRADMAAADDSNDAYKTIKLDDDSNDPIQQRLKEILAIAKVRDLTPEEKAESRDLAKKANERPARSKPTLSADEAHLCRKRLHYLCQLVNKSRRPYCPANGLMVLVPWESLETDVVVQSTALALRTDLATARSATKLCCPAVGLVCDLEDVRGFRELREGMNDKQRAGRIGQRTPLVPDQPVAEQSLTFEAAANWLGERMFPRHVYHSLALDERDDKALVARSMFFLFRAASDRMPRLAKLLKGGLPLPTGAADGLDGPLLFAGCYLGGTGRTPDQQAFIAGVFARLVENQGVVAWTDTALRDDAKYRRIASAGFTAVAVVVGCAVALGAWRMKGG